jgi:hypothetical protein
MAATFAAAAGEGGRLSWTATADAVAAQVGGPRAGAYELALVLGDASAAKGLEWAAGEVALAPRPAPAGAPATPADPWAPRPEIAHRFRPPAKRAPAAAAALFTALVAAPLAALILVAAPRAGANLRGLPARGAPAAWALAFHLGGTATLAALVLFWARLTLAAAAPALAALVGATMFAGARLAAALAAARPAVPKQD